MEGLAIGVGTPDQSIITQTATTGPAPSHAELVLSLPVTDKGAVWRLPAKETNWGTRLERYLCGIPWLRMSLLKASRRLGSIRKWLSRTLNSYPLYFLIILTVISVLAWLVDQGAVLLGGGWLRLWYDRPSVEFFTWLREVLLDMSRFVWDNKYILFGLALFVSFYFLLRTIKNNVVIDKFVSGGNDLPANIASGVSTMLLGELLGISRLYGKVRERRLVNSVSGGTGAPGRDPVRASFMLEDVVDSFKNFMSIDSKIKLGPVEIPAGLLASIPISLVRAPRISGSLYLDNDKLILVAHREGGERPLSWVVEAPYPGKGPQTDASPAMPADGAADALVARGIQPMVRELAGKVFSDIALEGTIRSRAAMRFAEGLRVYRDSLSTDKNHVVNLLKAESLFMEALAEDQTYTYAYHNLGVVYSELGKREAAEKAFTRSIETNPECIESYYGLALQRFSRCAYADTICLCDRIIAYPDASADDLAKASGLRGTAYRKALGYYLQAVPDGKWDERAQTARGLSRESHAMAVAHAWRALCSDYLHHRNCDESLEIAIRCLSDMAVSFQDPALSVDPGQRIGMLLEAIEMLSQAIELSPGNAGLFYQRGKCYGQLAETYRAPVNYSAELAYQMQELSRSDYAAAIRLQSSNAIYHASLFCPETCSSPMEQAAVRATCETMAMRAAESFHTLETENLWEIFEDIGDGYGKIHDEGCRTRAKELQSHLLCLLESNNRGQSALKDALSKMPSGWDGWDDRPKEVLRTAIKHLQLRKRDYYIEPRCFYDALDKLRSDPSVLPSIKDIEQARWKEPLEPCGMIELASSYFLGGEYQEALTYYRSALQWDPENEAIYARLGATYINIARQCASDEGRKEPLRNAIQTLEDGLRLCTGKETAVKGFIYFWLGTAYSELGDYNKAKQYLNIANILNDEDLVPQLYIANTHLNNRNFAESGHIFEQLCKKCVDVCVKKDWQVPYGEKYLKEPYYLYEVYLQSCLMLAEQFIEMGVGVEQVRQLLDDMEKVTGFLDYTCKNKRHVKYRAHIKLVEGWLNYEDKNYPGAVANLERSIGIYHTGLAQYVLALVNERMYCEAIARGENDTALIIKARIQGYCHFLASSAEGKDYEQKVKDLLVRLDEAAKKNSGNQTATQQKPPAKTDTGAASSG